MAAPVIPLGNEASLLQNIFVNASIGIVETGLDFRIRVTNPAACDLFYDGRDIIGLSLSDLIREKETLDEVARRLRSEEVKRFEGKWTPESTQSHTQFKAVITLSRDNYYNVIGYLAMCEEVVFHKVCCVCRRAETREGWVPLEELFDQIASLSHTYCPDCMPRALASVREFLAE